jgi:cyclic pyranopterin phosphate synthase
MMNNRTQLASPTISDELGRTFKTLRISLTDSCNLACTYCVSPDKEKLAVGKRPVRKRLEAKELLSAVKSLLQYVNIETIRLTGGEPLLYKNISWLISELKQAGVSKVKITTNGVYLKDQVKELKAAGLDSINVSVDAIDEDLFYKITRRTDLDKVLEGIDEALLRGIPLKINSVIMKDVNQSQILPLLEFAGKRNTPIRYLELMKMGHMYFHHSRYYVSAEEILNTIKNQYEIMPMLRADGATAKYWMTEDLKSFGVIANNSDPFCHDCNRLRLDSFGNIFGCLSSSTPINIMDSLNTPSELIDRLQLALNQKQRQFTGSPMTMKSIGG